MENWIDSGDRVEFDVNRLNSIFIHTYTMVIDTNFDDVVEDNIYNLFVYYYKFLTHLIYRIWSNFYANDLLIMFFNVPILCVI